MCHTRGRREEGAVNKFPLNGVWVIFMIFHLSIVIQNFAYSTKTILYMVLFFHKMHFDCNILCIQCLVL